MKKQIAATNDKKREFSRVKCWLLLTSLLISFIPGNMLMGRTSRSILQLFLYAKVRFVCTFLRFLLYRFWYHDNNGCVRSSLNKRHLHHHTYPTEIKVTTGKCIVMVLVSTLLYTIIAIINNYFTLLAGLWTGFSGLLFIHYFLHHGLAKKNFPYLLKYHIVHHCKCPDKCYGITVTWWDYVFRTFPPKQIEIFDQQLSAVKKGWVCQ